MRTLLFLLLCVAFVYGVDNGLGRTPQMAWNSWNAYECDINETVIMETAKTLVSSGLAAAGYKYVNMDDCWAGSRNATGYIEPDPKDFPSGIPALTSFVHNLGLKFGLYSDAGIGTCAGRPGSLGYETKDATQYAAWGVDYLKYDNCWNNNLSDPLRYTNMSHALNATGRPIFFSLCDWVVTTAFWASDVGNSWRTTTDINPTWESITSNIDQSNMVANFSGPGGWNDPDMLEVGNGNLTADENKAHFSLWALAKAPLILGNIITEMDKETLKILTNPEVIAVNQDPLGVQGIKLSINWATDDSLYDTLLISAPCSDLPSQKWSFSNNYITSGLNDMCVGEYGQDWNCKEQASYGDNLYLQPCNGTCSGNSQRWIIDETKGNIRTFFQNIDVNFCLTRIPSFTQQIMLWTCSNFTNPELAPFQKWKFNSDGTIESPDGQCITVSGGKEVWGGPLEGDAKAVILFNRAQKTQPITVSWSQIGLASNSKAAVRDLWEQEHMGIFKDSYTARVNSHGVHMLKITPYK